MGASHLILDLFVICGQMDRLFKGAIRLLVKLDTLGPVVKGTRDVNFGSRMFPDSNNDQPRAMSGGVSCRTT